MKLCRVWPASPESRGTAAEGIRVSFAEVDIRTSIRPTVAEIDLGAVQRNLRRVPARRSGPASAIFGRGQGRRLRSRRGRRWPARSSRCATRWPCRWSKRGSSCARPGFARPSSCSAPTTTVTRTRSSRERLTPVVYDARRSRAIRRTRPPARGRPSGRAREDRHRDEPAGHRPGASCRRLLARDRASCPSLRLGGLCTHFASADLADAGVDREALARFAALCSRAARSGSGFARSASITPPTARRPCAFPTARLDAVRPGPRPLRRHALGAWWRSRVSSRRSRCARDHGGARGRRRATASATAGSGAPRGRRASPRCRVGYADGYPRHVRGAAVLVRRPPRPDRRARSAWTC